jgi:hypothetical protein
MTHAECKDLLLELICGELSPERAAEVELHLAGCAECRAERDSLSETRAAFAPMMSGLEAGEAEPGPDFDLPILAAAREAAAGMARAAAPSTAPQASVISLAEVRAAARVPDAQRLRHKPRWMRAALIGSIAAAAALALVVSTGSNKANKVILGVPAQSAEEVRSAEQKGAQAHEDNAIKTKLVAAEGDSSAEHGLAQPVPAGAPPQAPPEPSKEMDGLRAVAGVSAATGRGRGGGGLGLLGPSGSAKSAAPKAEFAPPPENWIGDRAEKKKSTRDVSIDALDDASAPAAGSVGGLSRGAAGGASQGSAGSLAKDSAPAPGAVARKTAAQRPTDDKPAEREALKREESKADAQTQMARTPAPAVAASAPEAPPAASRAPPPPAPVAVMSPPPPPGAMHAAPRTMQTASSGKSASSAADREEPPSLEERASSARATGQLRQAGRLYREAAEAQFALSTPEGHARGANDLANAVACYAQAGELSEARKLRDRLVSLAADEPSAIARANGEIEARLPRRPAAADVPASNDR